MSFSAGAMVGALGLNISNFMSGVNTARAASAGLTQQLRAAAAVNTTFGNSLGSSSLRVAASLGAATAGFSTLAASISFSVQQAAQFEQAFADIKKVMQGTSEAGLKVLKEDLIELTKVLPVASVELFKIAQIAAQLGLSAGEIPNFAKVVGQLITIQGGGNAEKIATDLAKFADITKTSYGEVDKLANSLVTLANKTTATESNILSLSFRLAPIAAKAGATSAEIMALSASLIGAGLQSEVAGTAVGRFIESINNAVVSGNSHLNLYAALAGKTAQQFKEDWKNGMTQTLLDTVQGFGRFTDVGGDTAEILRGLKIEGFRVNVVLDAMNQTMDKFRSNTQSANGDLTNTETLLKAVEEKSKILNAQWTLLKNNAKDLADSIGRYLTPALTEVIKLISSALSGINMLMTKSPGQLAQVKSTAELETMKGLRDRVNSGGLTTQDIKDFNGGKYMQAGAVNIGLLNKDIAAQQMGIVGQALVNDKDKMVDFGKDLFTKGYEALDKQAKEAAIKAGQSSSEAFKNTVNSALAEAKEASKSGGGSKALTELEKMQERGRDLFQKITPGANVVGEITEGLKELQSVSAVTAVDIKNLVEYVVGKNSKKILSNDTWLGETVEKLKQMGTMGQQAISVISQLMDEALDKTLTDFDPMDSTLPDLMAFIDPLSVTLQKLTADIETLKKYGKMDEGTASLLSKAYVDDLGNASVTEYSRIEAALSKLGLTGEKLKAQLDIKKTISNLGEMNKIGSSISKLGGEINALGGAFKTKIISALGITIDYLGSVVAGVSDIMAGFKAAKEVGKTAFEALSLTIQSSLGVIGMVLAAIQAVLSVMGMFGEQQKELTGVAKVIDDIKKASDQWVNDFTDQLLTLTKTGKASFKEMFQSMMDDMYKLGVSQLLVQPMFKFIGGFLGMEKGGSISNGVAYAAKGMELNRPTFISTSSGPNVIASEYGQTEYVMPAARGKNGVLGVTGHISASPTIINVHDNRSSGERVEVRESSGPDGIKQIDIVVRDSVRRLIHGRELDQDMSIFGMQRRPV